MSCVSGPDKISVPGGMSSNIDLNFVVPKSGVTHGSVSFVNMTNLHYVWFTIEIHAEPPPVEEVVAITAEVRDNM
eukprot:576052-Prorocentrum_minimum.AAC.1